MTRSARLVTLYSAFVLMAMAANIGSQALIIWLYKGPFSVPLSVLVGTVVGLPIKYFLEKRHIFNFEAKNILHGGRIFMLYSFLGGFTTAIFWGIEWGFHRAFGTDTMRYIGGVIGLTLGNILKYHLDKQFVFVHRTNTWSKAA